MLRRTLLSIALALSFVGAAPALAAPTLSTSDRLDERRYVATGSRAYVVGTEAGRFPAMGFHTRGEMGGVWTPPIKLVDGIWFGLDGEWVGPATRFTSGYGHVQMDLPSRGGLRVTRTDFAPDGRRAVLVGLRIESEAARTVDLRMQTHSELMSIYPWGETKRENNTQPLTQNEFNLADSAAFEAGALVFREQGTPVVPNAEAHDWAAVVGSTLTPEGGEIGAAYRGPQGAVICPASGPDAPAQPDRCDDTAYGKGAGGELRYSVVLAAGTARTVWFAVAGSDEGLAAAQEEYAAALADPQAALDEKIAERERLAGYTRLSLPSDRLLQQGIDWSKQNLADSVQEARDLEIRSTNAGRNYPAPEGEIPHVRFLAAGFPDYPWLFATDGEYTAFASVAVGQFQAIKDHMRGLREASLIDNGGSGKVVHEVIQDGSVFFGSNEDPGNTDETAKFPSTVALIWRWSGDNSFRDEMYPFAKSNMEYIFRELDADGDLWPEGLGNVERAGMGEEKLDNAVYTLRGLRDLADLARSKGDGATQKFAEDRAKAMEQRFEAEWWMGEIPAYADSLDDPGNAKVQQRHWIGATPMEVELTREGQPVPGLASPQHARLALGLRETPCYGDERGLFHTGEPGCDPANSGVPAERAIFTLNTSIMAVAEGNYGRLGRRQQGRFTAANRALQLPEPDEQPGAMPEVAPSPDYSPGGSVDRKFTERAMVLQAWGNYGTIWPVVHQHLGVRPDMGNNRLEVTPQVPPDAGQISATRIRVGSGSLDVSARADGTRWRTRVRSRAGGALTIGHTLPVGVRVGRVTLDGRRVFSTVRNTNRGQEVLVRARGRGTHTLVVSRSRLGG